MIIPDKRKAASIIVSKMGQDMPDDGGGDAPDDGGDEGLKAAAEDVLSAIEGKSADALKDALKAFFQMVDKDEPMGE